MTLSSVPRLRCTPSRCMTQVSLIKRAFYFATKLNNDKSEQNPKYICHIAEQNSVKRIKNLELVKKDMF